VTYWRDMILTHTFGSVEATDRHRTRTKRRSGFGRDSANLTRK
jgi:hypothetical protein